MQNDGIQGENEQAAGVYSDTHEDCEGIFNEIVRVLHMS